MRFYALFLVANDHPERLASCKRPSGNVLNSILQCKSLKFHKQPKQHWRRHTSFSLDCWLSVFVYKSWRDDKGDTGCLQKIKGNVGRLHIFHDLRQRGHIWWRLQTINLHWRLQLWRRANLVQAGGKEEWDLSDKKQVTTTSFMESDDLGIMDSGFLFKRKLDSDTSGTFQQKR